MQPISIFDMDRTITRGGTYTPWLLHWAVREAPWRLIFVPLCMVAGLVYLAGVISRGRLKEINHRLLMGSTSSSERVAARAAAFGAHITGRRSFPDAIERIAAEKAAGRRVVLATASYDFYVHGIAAELGVEEIIATRAVRGEHGAIVARLMGENCYGDAKLQMVLDYFAEQKIEREEAHVRFFSDHYSDLPMFEWADEQIVVNPKARLRALADARGWTIERWR